MVRLCLRAFAGSAIAFISLGCTGQNLEGTWLGPLPLEDTKACRIKIYSDHRFDVACGKLDWVGAGEYNRDGEQLTLNFKAWVRKGIAQKAKPVLNLTFVGEGNKLTIQDSDVKGKFVWERATL